uniref:Protein kinase domain-containing protein n=1 Tax=Eptatretus burgeri TaxID=7764 RepID=A0A8C4NLP5_EPTBU
MCLYRGSYGVVHCVSNIVTSTDYAAKLIPASRGHREDALRELRILKSLRHPHVIQLHDMFYGHRSIIALLELCSNEELLERIVKQATLSELQVQMYMKQLLEGISYLHHHNILHLDIEPSNILLAHPLKDNIRICDFGFAQELSPEGPQYSRFGSPEFIAPEIVLQMPVCKATDIWKRPQAEECLKHFWFEAPATTSCATDRINFFLSRRKLQRSLVRYKSGVVLKSVAQILADPVGHSALKVARPSRKLRVHYPLAVSSESEDSEFDERCIMPSFSEPNEHVNEGNERDAFDPYLKPLPELKQPVNTAFNLQDPKLHVPKSSSGIKTPLEVCKNSNKDIENMKLFSLETLKINDRQSDLEKLASPCLTTVPLTTIGNISGCNYNKDQKSVLKNRKCTNIPPISYSKFSSDCGHRHEKHRNALSRVVANAKGQLEDQDGEPRQLTCCSEDLDVLKSHIEQSTQKSNCSSNDESMLQSTKYMPSTHCAENTHTQQDKKRALMSFEHFDDQSQLNIVGTTVGPNPLVVESQQSAGHGISSNQFKFAPIKSERSLTKRVMQNLFSRALKSPRLRVRCSSQGQTMPSVQNLEGTDDATQNKSTTSEFIPVDFLDENSSGVKKPFKKSLCYLKSRQLKQSEMASLSKDSCIPSSPNVGIPVTLHENQEPESFDSDANENTDWTLRDMEYTNYITKADSMDIISLGAKRDKAVQSAKSNNLKTQKSLAGELKYKDNSMDVHADDYNYDVVSAGKDNEVKMGTTLQNKELYQVDSVRNWRNEKNAISCQVPATPCTKCGTKKLESIDSLQNLADVGKDTMEKSRLKGFRHGKHTEGDWWVPPRSPGAVLRQKLGAAMSGFSLRRHQTENWRKDIQWETSPVELKNSSTGLPINFTTLNLHTQPLLKPPPSPSAWSYHSTRSDGTNANSQGGQPHLGDWNVNHFSSKNQPSANSSTQMNQKVANEVTSPTRRRKTLTCTLKSLATSRKRQGFPPSFQLPLRDLDPVEGSSVTLCCLPAGSDPLSISWAQRQQSAEWHPTAAFHKSR